MEDIIKEFITGGIKFTELLYLGQRLTYIIDYWQQQIPEYEVDTPTYSTLQVWIQEAQLQLHTLQEFVNICKVNGNFITIDQDIQEPEE